jgi:hypothetical protein
VTDHSHEHDFDSDDRINSESELDDETRALLYSLFPDDFPVSYRPILEDSRLAMLLHQMPENTESFTALLRDAGPSPVKSTGPPFDFNDFADEESQGFGFKDYFSDDVFAFYQGGGQVETQTISNINYFSSVSHWGEVGQIRVPPLLTEWVFGHVGFPDVEEMPSVCM